MWSPETSELSTSNNPWQVQHQWANPSPTSGQLISIIAVSITVRITETFHGLFSNFFYEYSVCFQVDNIQNYYFEKIVSQKTGVKPEKESPGTLLIY